MYTYYWLRTTLDKLANIYVAASVAERDRMAAGVEAFNTRLEFEPRDVGEARSGGYRIAFLPLLRVYFFIDEMNRRVEVTDVIRFGR